MLLVYILLPMRTFQGPGWVLLRLKIWDTGILWLARLMVRMFLCFVNFIFYWNFHNLQNNSPSVHTYDSSLRCVIVLEPFIVMCHLHFIQPSDWPTRPYASRLYHHLLVRCTLDTAWQPPNSVRFGVFLCYFCYYPKACMYFFKMVAKKYTHVCVHKA